MRSFTQTSFWEAYRRLPEPVQQQAHESYRLFASNPRHPSLAFKRVSIDYRALGVLDEGDMVWFWIGPHHEYDQLLKRV